MNKKNLIIIILSILLVTTIGIIIYLIVSNKKDTLTDITGKVIVADSKYVIINTEHEDFIVSNIKGTYAVGDIVKITYNNSHIEDISPKPIKALDEELIEVNQNSNQTNNTDSNDKDNDNTDNNSPNNKDSEDEKPNQVIESSPEVNEEKPTSKPNNNFPVENNLPSTNNVPNPSNPENSDNSSNSPTDADTIVLSYVNDYKKELDAGNITDNLKKGFVTVIDFLFYNGTIKGYYFKELTDAVKLKVLAIAMYFDAKIEKYFPGYKETISTAVNKIYTNIKSKIVAAYLNITTKICTNNPDLCLTAKEDFQSLKADFGLTWDLLKDIAGDGLTNLKNWYEIWRTT